MVHYTYHGYERQLHTTPTSPFVARMQSQRGSTHSPHKMRNIIMKEWKKSVKFHLQYRSSSQQGYVVWIGKEHPCSTANHHVNIT